MAAAEADPEDGLVGWDWTEEDWRPAGKLSHRCSIGTQRYDVYADASRNWLIGFSIIDDRRRHPASSTSNASSLPIHPLLLIDDPLPSATISLPSSLPHRSVGSTGNLSLDGVVHTHSQQPQSQFQAQSQSSLDKALEDRLWDVIQEQNERIANLEREYRRLAAAVAGTSKVSQRLRGRFCGGVGVDDMILWELGPGVTARGEESRAVDG
jgi:hypothetical protein